MCMYHLQCYSNINIIFANVQSFVSLERKSKVTYDRHEYVHGCVCIPICMHYFVMSLKCQLCKYLL